MKRMMSHLFHVALMLLAFTFANPVISHDATAVCCVMGVLGGMGKLKQRNCCDLHSGWQRMAGDKQYRMEK